MSRAVEKAASRFAETLCRSPRKHTEMSRKRFVMPTRRFVAAGFVFAAVVALSACASTRPESELLRDLDSPSAGVVCDALQALEKQYPGSAAARPKIVAKLDDSREEVRRKAARVLGS